MLKLNKRILLILAVFSILLIIPTSFAEDLANDTIISDVNDEIVTAGDDIIYVSDGDVNGDGSQNSPYNSISGAVDNYNSSVNSNIYIKDGNYKISSEVDLNKDITIIGQSKEGTFLDGQGSSSIFKVSTKSKITLVNLTFKNAKGNGALFLDSGDTIVVDNCIFDNNAAGGIYYNTYYINAINVTVKNSVFTNNFNSKDGGAIYLRQGSLTVLDSVFENNSAPIGESDASQGGAIYAGGGTLKTVYIDNCVFVNNTAIRGSAISHAADGKLYLFNSVFINNYAPGNSRYGLNSSVVNVKSSLKGIDLYLKNNTLENNRLINEIAFDEKVKVEYMDKNTKLTANNLEKIYGDDFKFSVLLSDNLGNPISGEEINVVLTNSYDKTTIDLSNITNADGIAVISLSDVKPGKYTVRSTFVGDESYDDISIQNIVNIRTENDYNVVLDPNNVTLFEGESFNVTGYVYDEYMMPTNDCSGLTFTIDWFEYEGKHLIVEGGLYKVDGYTFTFDVNRCHLITRDEPYFITFNVSEIGSARLQVDLSQNMSNIDENLDVIYVSKDGNDERGTGAKDSPLQSLQTALAVNTYLGGDKTIIVGEGVYEISTFTIVKNVTIIGQKSKTILKQVAGKLGMFEIDRANTVYLINLSFTGGYATPEPEGLIHVTDESVLYIDGCEFYENYAMDGAALALSRHAKVYVNNSYFHNNGANTSSKVYGIGGAIYIHDYSYLYLTNSLFVNNTARDGGAIFLGFGSEADIINTTFENNKAIVTTLGEGGGGAIFSRSSNINIFNSSFIENYADLCGGAIYLDYGDAEIYKSYFENNWVKRGEFTKGSTIQSSYTSYANITMHYSVLISEDSTDNYVVYICNIDENHTADTYYNYWKVNSPKSSAGSVNEIKIQVYIENEYIYTGDVVEFNVEFVNYNPDNGTSPLNESVHDLALNVIPTIGNVLTPNIVIKDNQAGFTYSATALGSEVVYLENIFNHTKCRFDVYDGSDKLDLGHTIDISVNKTSTITVNLAKDIKGNLTIRVNDKDYSVEVKDKKAVLEIETTPGDYSVQVIFIGNDIYKGFVDKDSFNVAKYASKIISEDITVFFNGKFQAILEDGDGNPISDEKLNININGKDYSAISDEKGIATLDLNLASVGEYDVITSFSGNANYNSSQIASKITVVYTDIKLHAQDITITSVNGSFKLTVTDNNDNPLNGVNVVVTINGTEYDVKTIADGTITIDLTDNNFEAGKINVYAEVKASGVYGANSTTAVITVEKIPVLINTSDISVFANSGEFIATLTDISGNPIVNKTIIFEVDGKTYENVTDEKGIATLNLNLTDGNYQIIAKLKEDKIFIADESSAIVKVISNSINIYAPNVVVYYANGNFIVTLTDVNGNPISTANTNNLVVILNGLSVVVSTGADGSGSIPINLGIGTYEAIVKYSGNNIFSSAEKHANITVLSSIESQDMTRAYLSPYDFEAKLVDSNGNPLVNEAVSVVVDGENYTVTTDAEGVLRLSENLTVGRHVITVANPKTGEEAANYATIVERITNNTKITMYFGANKYYKVRVYTDDGQVAGAGENVTFKINGKTYTRQTNADGYASYKITQSAKTYTITATYKGVNVSNKVVVKPVLTAKNISKKKAKTIKFTAKLVNTKGKALKNKKITFKFKGKTYKVKTNKKGIATLSLKNLKVGKYTIKTTYGKSTIKNTIKIKK